MQALLLPRWLQLERKDVSEAREAQPCASSFRERAGAIGAAGMTRLMQKLSVAEDGPAGLLCLLFVVQHQHQHQHQQRIIASQLLYANTPTPFTLTRKLTVDGRCCLFRGLTR